MSLFIAVRPNPEAVEDLQEALHALRRHPAATQVRWTSPSLWHITLGFLGDPDRGVDETVAERLREWSMTPAIAGLRLASAGSFGRRVLWAGIEEGPPRDHLAALARTIPRLLRGSGANVDKRIWRPHLTLGRLLHGSSAPVIDALSDALIGYRGPAWTATQVELVRSTGGPRPHHEVVGRMPLAEETNP